MQTEGIKEGTPPLEDKQEYTILNHYCNAYNNACI